MAQKEAGVANLDVVAAAVVPVEVEEAAEVVL